MRRALTSASAALAAAAGAAVAVAACAPAHAAVCVLSGVVPGQPDSGVRGVVRATQVKGRAAVRVHVRVTGLAPSSVHGLHVHALGNLVEGCTSAGGHFNPGGCDHGGPGDSVRHAGDLGNVVADASGVVDVVLHDAGISLAQASPLSVIGRALVLHADADDLGRGGHADSRTTGHAGARIACGVIGVDADADVNA